MTGFCQLLERKPRLARLSDARFYDESPINHPGEVLGLDTFGKDGAAFQDLYLDLGEISVIRCHWNGFL